MSPASSSSRIVEGLFHGAPASVLLLAFSLGLNARVTTSQVGFALQNPLELERGQGSDSVVGQSQQSERSTSPANAPKPVLTDGTLVRLKFGRAVVSSQAADVNVAHDFAGDDQFAGMNFRIEMSGGTDRQFVALQRNGAVDLAVNLQGFGAGELTLDFDACA